MSINNRIINGGFETGTFPPWIALNANITTQISHSGFFASQLLGGNSNSYVYQFVDANPMEQFEFLVSLANVGLLTSPPVSLSVVYYGAALTFLGYGLITNIPTNHIPNVADNTWLEVYETTSPAPLGTTQALVLVNKLPLAGTSDVIVDDVALLTVENISGPTGPTGATGATGPTGPGCIEPLPIATQIVYVNKAGNDATADGSECFPFLTVTAAMASIMDASPVKRYAISIGPGTYTEPLIHLKANVQLVGTSTLLTRLAIPFDINDPSWFETGFVNDNRSGFVDLALLSGPLNFNFATASSFSGKLFFVSVNITPTPVFTALTTSVNQVNIRDSMLSAGYTQNGINMVMFASFVSSGNITINSQGTTDAQVNLVGGGINGNVIINVQSGHIPIDPLNLTSFAISENIFAPFPNSGRLIVNGVNDTLTRVRATVDSIPIRTRVTLVGTGTSLIRVDDAFGLAYIPANPGDWIAPPPATVQEALDRIAASIGPA